MTPHVHGLDHVSFRTADLQASLRFYRDVLGIPVRDHGTLDGGGSEALTHQTAIPFADLDLGNAQTLELLQLATDEPSEPADRPWPGRTHVSLRTADIDAAYAAVTAARAPTSGPPTTITESGFWRGTQVLYTRDPDGHTVELIQQPANDRGPRRDRDELTRQSPSTTRASG